MKMKRVYSVVQRHVQAVAAICGYTFGLAEMRKRKRWHYDWVRREDSTRLIQQIPGSEWWIPGEDYEDRVAANGAA
jgi:hypothetical protein